VLVEVLALKRSKEGWAVESLHYLWQGAAETQRGRAAEAEFAPEMKKHPWRKSGTRDAANDMPACALSGREHHQDGSVLLHQHKQLVAKHQRQEQEGDETLTGSEMHGVRFKDCSAPEGQKSL